MVDSNKLELGCRMIYTGFPAFFGLRLEDGHVPGLWLLLYGVDATELYSRSTTVAALDDRVIDSPDVDLSLVLAWLNLRGCHDLFSAINEGPLRWNGYTTSDAPGRLWRCVLRKTAVKPDVDAQEGISYQYNEAVGSVEMKSSRVSTW